MLLLAAAQRLHLQTNLTHEKRKVNPQNTRGHEWDAGK
jgi:hypothetical protein